MAEEQKENASPEVQDAQDGEDLEFKPFVKYTGIGLAVLLLFGVEYATYRVGHSRGFHEGFDDGTSSGIVQEAVNAAAVQNLTHFMQAASADDATLLAAVQNRDSEMAWIKMPDIRREAEWTLVQALMDRGIIDKGLDMVATLVPQAPATSVWARRASLVADALAGVGRNEEAIAYYRFAAERYGVLQQEPEQLGVLSSMVELLAASPMADDELIAGLEALLQEVSALGDKAVPLRSSILAYMGHLYRQAGNSAKSLSCFEQALAGRNENTPELAGAAVCYGMALLETGETEKAEALLRDGVKRLGDTPADAAYLVAALRELARLEQGRGHSDEALGLLYRAEGVATGRIAEDNPFWPGLFDQRGWINYLKQLNKSAYVDFCKALEHKSHPELLAQPLEGAGRCCLAMGKGEDAVPSLMHAAELLRKYHPAAQADLGRVLLLLGQAYDMIGKGDEAVDSYGQAIGLLPADGADALFARMSRAYGLGQTARWAEALSAWEELLPMVKDDPAHSEEVKGQIQMCRRHGAGAPAAAEEAGEAADAPAAQAETPAPPARRPRRGRRR